MRVVRIDDRLPLERRERGWGECREVGFIALVVLLLPVLLVQLCVGWAYLDRHVHEHDVRGTPGQKARLARWRAACDRLGFVGRVRRGWVKASRRRRLRRRSESG